ncbi:MAG: CoA-binding protein [Acidobacteriia bacterium]|nr:CoA-binding protein [Terriglobia bacterium]
MNAYQDIEEFLGRKRLAVVGVSRDPKGFTRAMFRELLRCGYDAVPVTPNVSEVEGIPTFAHVQDVAPAAEAALLMTKPAVTDAVVRDCAQAGIRSIWMYRGTGAGAVSPAAVDFCRESGARVIAGKCPFMFLNDTHWLHRAHGFCRKLLGRYPR